MKKMKLIYIEWEDAIANSGWHSKGELDEWARSTCIIKEVGWLYKETPRIIVLVSRLDDMEDEESFGMLQKIPKTWIRRKKILKI